jgi:hypothetical protein
VRFQRRFSSKEYPDAIEILDNVLDDIRPFKKIYSYLNILSV